jgi:hypothetical protein
MFASVFATVSVCLRVQIFCCCFDVGCYDRTDSTPIKDNSMTS